MSTEDPSLDWSREAHRDLPPQFIEQLTRHGQAFRTSVERGLASPFSTPRLSLEKAALVRVRRDQATLSDAERTAFNQALVTMLREGTYGALTHVGSDPAHHMTGAQGAVGLHRFLPWHRRYLWEFESCLQRIDCRLRPSDLPLALPYWNWSGPLPSWLTDFSDGRGSALERGAVCSPLKPTCQDIRSIVHESNRQLPAAGVSPFVRFTYALEGWGRRPDGTPLPGHNQVQAWLASILQPLPGQPLHPIFWLHLAQVDRLWCLWQSAHPGCGPELAGTDRVLDPWVQTADEMLRPQAIGYSYWSVYRSTSCRG